MVSLEQTLRQTHDWAIERITLLCDKGNHDQMEDAFALEKEFDDWIRTGVDNHEIYSLEYIGTGSDYD